MNGLTAVLCLVSVLALVSGHRYRRDETVSNEVVDAATDTAICLAQSCAQQYQTFINDAKLMKPAAGSTFQITSDKVDTICRNYRAAVNCRKTNCAMSSRFQDFFNMLGVIEDACNQKEAVVEHGQCLMNALKDQAAVEAGCASFMGGYLQAAKTHAVEHGHVHRRRFRKDAMKDAMKEKVREGIIKMKTSLKELPPVSCDEVTAARACVVQRAKDECDKDGSTEASELAGKMYDSMIRNVVKGVKSIQPAVNVPDMDTCLATSFFWFF